MSAGPTDRACSPGGQPVKETVYVVDGDASTREALGALLTVAGWQARTASSAEEFMVFPRTVTPCCLLVELTLPDMSGLELQIRVLDRTELQVIFMSRSASIPAIVQAMKAGAFEFLTKPLTDEAVLWTMRQAMQLSCAEVSRLARMRMLQERYQSLSMRERDVMRLVVSGRLNKQVGAELGISEITVKAHRGKVMRKMLAHSLPDLVDMAARLRLPGPGSAEPDAGDSFRSACADRDPSQAARPVPRHSEDTQGLHRHPMGMH